MYMHTYGNKATSEAGRTGVQRFLKGHGGRSLTKD